jgi:hypothetical protein
MEESKVINQCPEFPHFGARYPDACCIDGYLWDLDSYEDGMLYNGGDDPCPFCNTDAYLEWVGVDETDDEAPSKEQVLNHIQKLREIYG